MNKLTAAALCLSVLASPALADDFKADLLACEEQADLRASSSRHSSAKSSAINGAAGVLGAIVGGYNPGPALSGATQGAIHGAANDARQAEWRRQALVDACMREKGK